MNTRQRSNPMNRRLILAGLAATGGLVTTAFLQVAVAAADTAGPDAFTIGDFTFDPISASGAEGFDGVPTLEGAPPLLELGGGTVLGILPLATQDFNVYDPSTGAELGSIEGNENVASLFGLTNAEFTVASDNAAAGVDASSLPTVGSVYDVFNLGNGYENIYTALTPGTAGGSDTVTDILVTPNGDINLDSLFGNIDAAAPLNPGDAFTGLEAGDSSIGADAFSIGGFTLDPTLAGGAEGFTPVTPLASTPPLLEIGGSSLGDPTNPNDDFATQSFDVYSAAGQVLPTSAPSAPARMSQTCWASPTLNSSSLAPPQATVEAPRTCRRWDRSTTRSISAAGTRTSTPRSRAPAARRTPSPTPW